MINQNIKDIISNALREDVGNGDHTTLATVPASKSGKASLLVKEKGVLAGLVEAKEVFHQVNEHLVFKPFLRDGDAILPGDIAFSIEGNQQAILIAERLALNIMQRMSGIATKTKKYVDAVKGFPAKILDTRKTTPGFRAIEKRAVAIGGGVNHRFGLFDMILIKDNHVDYAGTITIAVNNAQNYLKNRGLNLDVAVEVRDFKELIELLSLPPVKRVLLDNFSPKDTATAVRMIAGKLETESSGGITLKNIRDYAACGVDYISVGDLTHHIDSLDLSLKADV